MDYYKVLGVNKDSSQDEIKKAYRKLSLKHHPDKPGGNADKFREINEAYQTIGDVNNRKKYDMRNSGHNPFGGGGMPFNGFHFNGTPEEMLKSMFGGNVPGGMPFFSFSHNNTGMNNPNIRIFRNGVEQTMDNRLKKPVPIIKTVEITLEQAYNGVKIPFELERWVLEGEIKKVEKETIYIDIPQGTDNNEIIIIRDKGNIISDTNKGDIKVFIKITNNTDFKRDGLNLILKKDVSLKDALCGFDFVIKYFNNRNFVIRNNDNIIKPGFSKVVPNLGIKRGEHTGSLVIVFNIIFPDKIEPDKIEKLKELL